MTLEQSGVVEIIGDEPSQPSESASTVETTTPTATNHFITHAWWVETVTNESWAYQGDSFDSDEIEQIIAIGSNSHAAQLTGNEPEFQDGVSQASWIRSDIESNRWIFQRLAGIIKSLNNQFFNLDITYIENVQFVKLEADKDGYIQKHTDTLYNSTGTRKLSFTVILSDQCDGGDLLLHLGATPTPVPRIVGTIYVYPSYVLREVTPVVSGTRYALTGTVIGPRFK